MHWIHYSFIALYFILHYILSTDHLPFTGSIRWHARRLCHAFMSISMAEEWSTAVTMIIALQNNKINDLN